LSPTILRPHMLSSLKAALALLYFALTVDALRKSGMEDLMKERRQMLHRRDFPTAKRAVPAQWATVRPTHWIIMILDICSGSFVPVQLPIDHWGSYKGTFQNRYWYSAKYYKPGGPVFCA
jgi:hypothetical protein